MVKILEYAVIIERGEDNYWVAHAPSLPGCHSQGKTREEAIKNIKEAIELYIETCISFGDPIPVPSKEIEFHKVNVDVSAT